MKTLFKYIVLYVVGGLTYILIELLYRGVSHWSMMVVGGIAFLLCGFINEALDCSLPLWQQGIIGGLMITLLEFIAGVVINIVLKLDVWDYSMIQMNILGQVCLPFTIVWCLLAVVAILTYNLLAYWFFGAKKPRYRLT